MANPKCRISAADVDFQNGSAATIVKLAATDVGNDGTLTFTSALSGGVVNLAGVNDLTSTGTINAAAMQVNGVNVATVTGVFWKQSVKVAELASNVATLSGNQTVDGVACTAGDRVLLGAQTNSADDGIYEVAGGSWSYVADLPSGSDAAGVAVFAQEGTNADSGLVCTNDTGFAQVGTDGLTFSVFSAKAIADGSITTAKLAADAVTGDKIADDAVDSEHIAAGAIDTAAIADNNVTIAKLADLSRGVMIVGNVSNETAELAAGTEAQLLIANANGDPTWVGLNTDVTITASGAVTIGDNAVTTSKIVNDAITTDKITDVNVTTAKIADDAITSAKLNEGWDTLGTAGQSHVVSTDSSGNITLIGDNSSDHGDITSTYGESTFVNHNSTSDIRLKENIQDISAEDALRVVQGSTPKVYTWKASGKQDSGFIAQEADVIVPHLVHRVISQDKDGNDSELLTLNYKGYTPYNTRVLQYVLARLDALEGGGAAAAPRAAKRKGRDDRGSSKVSR